MSGEREREAVSRPAEGREVDTASRLALVLLRYLGDWDQGGLARAAGIAPSLVSEYDRGKRTVPWKTLEKAAAALDFPRHLLDPLHAELRSFLAAARGRSRAGRVPARAAAAGLTVLLLDATDLLLAPLGRTPAAAPPASEDREAVEPAWERLVRRTPAERRLLVQELEEFQGWPLCERAAAASLEAAPNQPAEALEWAELALLVAERAPGERAWRAKLQGYAWAHLANARRVTEDLEGAEKALARAQGLWREGGTAGTGLLNEAYLPWIEAVQRRAQRRFPEALQRVEEALALDRGKLRGKILLSKSRILDTLGVAEASMTALAEAAPLIEVSREPQLAMMLRFNFLAALCSLGRAAEAEPELPEVRALAERLGEELDLLRVAWLEGKVAAGLGRDAEAERLFERVRRAFDSRKLAYNYALASLDLALLLLGQERTAEVRKLAGEMLWIFSEKRIHREGLAALRLFCDAAERDAATADLARQVADYLRRAQGDPELRFEP